MLPANKISKSLLFSLLFFFVSLLYCQQEKTKLNQQVLGQKTQMRAEQEEIYQWEQNLIEKPNYRDGWIYLAIAYAKADRPTQAREAITKAKDLDPTNETILSLEKLLKE